MESQDEYKRNNKKAKPVEWDGQVNDSMHGSNNSVF